MKRITILTAVIPFFLFSCTKDPYADFIVSKTQAEVGEVIYFTNRSYDAVDFEWDFGDGYKSANFNVSHFFENPGRYTVSLTAFGKGSKMDRSFIDIDIVNVFGSLEITVLEYNDRYPVYNASVRLYPTIPDWEDETNMIVEGFTNTQGRVIFTDLLANRRYYVDVWEANHDNYDLAADDVGFIETDVVLPDRMNYFTALVDYYESGKKSQSDRKSLKKSARERANPESPRKPVLK